MESGAGITRRLEQAWSWCYLAWWKLTASQWEKGQAIVEYGLLTSLISVVTVAWLVLIGPNLELLFEHVLDAVSSTDPTSIPSLQWPSGTTLSTGGGHWHCPPTSNGIHCR